MFTTRPDHTAHLEVDHEGNEITLTVNGDAAAYGAFLEVAAADGTAAVTAHLTPEAMADLGRFLLGKVGLL